VPKQRKPKQAITESEFDMTGLICSKLCIFLKTAGLYYVTIITKPYNKSYAFVGGAY